MAREDDWHRVGSHPSPELTRAQLAKELYIGVVACVGDRARGIERLRRGCEAAGVDRALDLLALAREKPLECAGGHLQMLACGARPPAGRGSRFELADVGNFLPKS